MGINIPRKKLFFNEDAADRAVGVGGPLPPPRFWQIKLTFLNQGLQIMPTTLLIASPGFLDLPKGLAQRYVPDFRLLRIIACPFQSIPSNDTHMHITAAKIEVESKSKDLKVDPKENLLSEQKNMYLTQ